MIKWEATQYRANSRNDLVAEVKGKGTYSIRRTEGRDKNYIVRLNGKQLSDERTLQAAKAYVEADATVAPPRLEGKAYAARAIKLALREVEGQDAWLRNDDAIQYLNAALDVLEGRVPRLAVLPEDKL